MTASFDSAKTGILTLAANTFTDGDSVPRTAEVVQLGFGALHSIPTIVSASDPLPVTLSGVKATASVLGATPVAAANRTDLFAGTDGVFIVRPHTSLEDIISEVKTNTDGASIAMVSGFAATASQRIYLTTLCLANSSATAITVDIRDGAAGSVLFTVPVPAGAGVVVSFPVPLRFSANTAAAFDGSAAASTLTCSMVGFKSKA